MQHRHVADLVRDLLAFCESENLTVSEFARKAEVPQPTVHRILNRPRSNRITRHLQTLCNYADIPIFVADKPDPSQNGVIMSALREVWDGTEASARAIAKMLFAARDAYLPANKRNLI